MKMKCLAVILSAFGTTTIASLAQAQEAPSGPAATADPAVSADYTLQGGRSVGPADRGAPSIVSPTYGLAGSGFRMAQRSDDFILTAPVPPHSTPVKTDTGIFFYPTVFFGVGHNDNILGTNANKVESGFVNVSPAIVGELKTHGDRYTAAATINALTYDSSRNDDFVNHEVWVAGDNIFSNRARMGWALGQIGSIDPRGSTQRQLSDHPDRWSGPALQGRFIYGAAGAAGRVDLDFNYFSKRYDNNRLYTELADVDKTEGAARFYYRIGSRSQVFAELRQAEFDYKSALSTEDNTERRYYLGLAWEATVATIGTIKVGRMTKDFAQAGRADFSGGSWEAAVRWLPRTYSVIDFGTSRETVDASGYGDYVLSTANSVTWSHNWTSYLASRLSFGSVRAEFVNGNRTDNTRSWGATMTYDLLRWLTIGVDYANIDRSSTDPAAAFKRNVVMLTLNATM